MNNFEGIEDALDVASDIVPASKPAPPVPVEEFASTKEQLRKIMNTQEATYTLSSRKDRKQLTVSLILLNSLINQEHLKLLVS